MIILSFSWFAYGEKKNPILPGVENLQRSQDVAQGLLFADVRVLGQDDLGQRRPQSFGGHTLCRCRRDRILLRVVVIHTL